MNHRALKIILAGPKQSGKTTIANFLSDPSKTDIGKPDQRYDPTVGCRILEFELDDDNTTTTSSPPIELWDVSGNVTFENCWPAILQGPSDETTVAILPDDDKPLVDGVILIYDPDRTTHEAEIELWYDQFVRRVGLSDERCMVLVLTREPKVNFRSRPPVALEGCVVRNTTFEDGKDVREGFKMFVGMISNR